MELLENRVHLPASLGADLFICRMWDKLFLKLIMLSQYGAPRQLDKKKPYVIDPSAEECRGEHSQGYLAQRQRLDIL